MTVEEVNQLWAKGYNSREFYENNPELKEVLDEIKTGIFLMAKDFFSRLLTR